MSTGCTLGTLVLGRQFYILCSYSLGCLLECGIFSYILYFQEIIKKGKIYIIFKKMFSNKSFKEFDLLFLLFLFYDF